MNGPQLVIHGFAPHLIGTQVDLWGNGGQNMFPTSVALRFGCTTSDDCDQEGTSAMASMRVSEDCCSCHDGACGLVTLDPTKVVCERGGKVSIFHLMTN
jgi:hypothetical protein